MKIVYFTDPCSNAVDNSFQREVISRFADLGSLKNEVAIVDVELMGRGTAIDLMLQQEYDAYFTYNRTGTDIYFSDSAGVSRNLMGAINRPHLCWLTEHPLCWYENYYQSQNLRHYVLPRQSHSSFLDGMGLVGTRSVQLFGAEPDSHCKTHGDRKYDMCIAAQWRGSETANEFWLNSDGIAKEFFTKIVSAQESDAAKDTYHAYKTVAEEMRVDLSDRIKHAQLMRGLYWHARKRERIEIVRSMVGSGLKIALIGGNAWRSVLQDSSSVDIFPECDHRSLISLYAESRSVVNLNAANGACERAFDAAATGAMLITEYSPAMQEVFADFDAAVFYLPKLKYESLSLIIDLVKTRESEAIGKNGFNCLIKGHTWEHRARHVSDIFQQIV